MFCSLIEQGVPQVCTPARTPQIVHFKHMQFIVPTLYFNKVDLKIYLGAWKACYGTRYSSYRESQLLGGGMVPSTSLLNLLPSTIMTHHAGSKHGISRKCTCYLE